MRHPFVGPGYFPTLSHLRPGPAEVPARRQAVGQLLGYLHLGFFAAREEFSDYAAFFTSCSGLALRQANSA